MRKILVLLITLSARLAFAGSGAHGADVDGDQNNVWFLGAEPIPYCLTLDAGSGLTEQEARALVSESFNDWRKFFDSYGYGTLSFGAPDRIFKLGYALPDGPQPMSREGHEIPHCDQPDRQIEFRFATSINPEWDLDSEHSLGAAVRGPYDHRTYRTGGVVWLSSTLRSRAERKHVLLHELGHVFGMTHNSVFVMYDKIARLITLSRKWPQAQPLLGHIESQSWRYLLRPGNTMELDSGNQSGESADGSLLFSAHRGEFVFPIPPSRVTLHYAGAGKAGGSYEFEVSFSGKTKDQSLRGTFHRRSHNFEIGPSLTTVWKRNGRRVQGRYYLEMAVPPGRESVAGGSKQIPLEGSFTFNGNVYPAIIEFPYGAVVRIFDFRSGRWLNFSSYPFEISP